MSVGTITTNTSGNSGNIKSYVTNYTYATSASYTYTITDYTYSTNVYTYTIFSATPNFSTNSYDDVLSGGNYYSTTALGNTIVTGNATLVLPNGYNIGNLTIAPGGSLTLYVGGTTLALNGNQVINEQGLSQDLIIYAAPTVTTVSFTGNAAFTGVIVAPNATATMDGGGNNQVDYSGALMVNSVTMNGKFNFHYDVALSRVPSPGRFVAKTWQEIPVPQL
jgi:hypothetical protein